MNRVMISTVAAATVLALLASDPAGAQRSFQILSAGRSGPAAGPGSTVPRHRMFGVVDRSGMDGSASDLTGERPRQRGGMLVPAIQKIRPPYKPVTKSRRVLSGEVFIKPPPGSRP